MAVKRILKINNSWTKLFNFQNSFNKFVSERIENIFGKEEIPGDQHFPFFPKCFQKHPSLGSLKVQIVWSRVKGDPYNKICEKHFLLFPQIFQKASFSGSLKHRIVWQMVNA